MSYGHSAFGGVSRCYEHYTGFMQCMEKTAHPKLCQLERDDYFECLHLTKMKTRGAIFGQEVQKYLARQAAGDSATAAASRQ